MKRANIIKPQNAFERKVDNFDTGAFKPLLSTKPHATVPLEKSLIPYVDDFGNPQYVLTRSPYQFVRRYTHAGFCSNGREGNYTYRCSYPTVYAAGPRKVPSGKLLKSFHRSQNPF